MTYKVWLDAGHGGQDPGAAAYGMKEKDLVLQIVLATKSYLEAHYSNVEVGLSRSGDYFLSLSERARKANRWGADLFVSVHINAGGGTGFESYTYPGMTGATKRLQQSLHEEILLTMKAFGQVSDRGQKEANLAVVRETSMPAVLTENLFIDRREDVEKLKQPNFIQAVGEAHGRGIATFCGQSMVKVDPSNYKKEEIKSTSPTDTRKYRLMTGSFKSADELANGIARLKRDYDWLIYEKADSTELNPTYRIVTGTFTGKETAEKFAAEIQQKYSWLIYVKEV
ncbi:N-acetylmuramoyl-L-alanine amidase [Priestia filamentosa]|uniref:N-acetylmuramoyl-L-alanine amidase n=1 Tax=Priestia filamentosa TaxID=1402861 RepID=UPI002E1FE299|nr:N-acetylmuramoyl-L-alanine amidase [Priestia filamentosa]